MFVLGKFGVLCFEIRPFALSPTKYNRFPKTCNSGSDTIVSIKKPHLIKNMNLCEEFIITCSKPYYSEVKTKLVRGLWTCIFKPQYFTLSKIPKFHLIPLCGDFRENSQYPQTFYEISVRQCTGND